MADLRLLGELFEELNADNGMAAVAQQVDREMAEINAAQLRKLDAELFAQFVVSLEAMTEGRTWQ
jgi:hypothetical protein